MSANQPTLPPAPPSHAGHPSPEDLILYAMQLLAEAETARITTHLEHCEACRAQLGRIYGDLSISAAAVNLETPSAGSRQRFLQQVAREKKIVSASQPQATPRPVLAPTFGNSPSREMESSAKPVVIRRSSPLAWMGWPIAALLTVGVTFLAGDRKAMRDALNTQNDELRRLDTSAASAHLLLDALTDPRAVRVTLTAKPQPTSGPRAGVTYNPDKGTLIFLASELDPLEPAKTYELWLIPQDGAPIPAGTFHPDNQGNASVVLPDLPKGIPAKGFGVTIEKDGGSQKPTLPIIMAGS